MGDDLALPHVKRPSEKGTWRDPSSTSAHMQAPDGEELTRGHGMILAHMQALIGVHSQLESDEVLVHMRTPGEIKGSDMMTAHMQSSSRQEGGTPLETLPAYMRSLEEESNLKCIEVAFVREIMATMASYFAPGEVFPFAELVETVKDAQDMAATNYGVTEAVEWAQGYEFPEDMLTNDLKSFKEANYDFTDMVKARLTSLQSSRLNLRRISRLTSDNPELLLLRDLAVGRRVPIPIGFKPNGSGALTPLRASYLKVHQAVNKIVAETVSSGLGFLLPKDLAIETIPRLHLCTAHWAQKKGKKSGRPIGDMTYVDGTALNAEEATKEAGEYYGPIRHPTIDDIAVMIMDFFTAHGTNHSGKEWSDLRIWKMDLKGAYNLLSFRPNDVSLFGMEVTGDLIYLQLCGIFGWACTSSVPGRDKGIKMGVWPSS